jgi:hypothetical protein
MNIKVKLVTANSARVSWDSIDMANITQYIVYYSQKGQEQAKELSATVIGSINSVVINGLVNNVQYQFQVVAVAELDGDEVIGQRSMLTVRLMAITKLPGITIHTKGNSFYILLRPT